MNQTQIFYAKLTAYSAQMPFILDDYIKSYVNYSMNSDNNEAINAYNAGKSHVQTIKSNVFSTTNEIQSDIDKLYNEIEILDAKIEIEKAKNKKLNEMYTKLLNSGDGSSGLISDYTDLYKIQYITNISIIIGMFIILGLLFSIFKKKQIMPNNKL